MLEDVRIIENHRGKEQFAYILIVIQQLADL
jgi:hypothetical protein